MKKSLLSLIVVGVLIGVCSGCSGTHDALAGEEILAMTLRVEAQDPRAPWTAVSYAPGRLVWSKCNLDTPFDGKVFSEEINSADIPVFLQEISKLGVFQWGGATYRPPRKVADGTTWTFHLKTTAREVSVSGYENSPSHFPEFLLAVKKLTRGKTDMVFMQLGLDRLKSN